MTTFGWDDSHWGGIPTARDGIDFYTHKCAEGHHFYKDTEYKQAMTSAKALGIPVLGAYFVNHPGTVVDQVDWFLEVVKAETPWYKDVPWIWQIDAEKFPQMDRAPNLAEINAFGDLICSRTGMSASSVIAYAPKWLYGNTLVGLKYKLWASSYVSGVRSYETLYPGDTSVRWAPYSEQTPIILQYSSSSLIAGQVTCDANAYRGTLDSLIKMLGGEDGCLMVLNQGLAHGGPMDGLEVSSRYPKGVLVVDRPNNLAWLYDWSEEAKEFFIRLGYENGQPLEYDARIRAAEEFDFDVMALL